MSQKIIESGYFINPSQSEASRGLAEMASFAIMVMSTIYATGGKIENLPDQPKNLSEADQKIYQVLMKLLHREAKTRRFDERFMGQIHPQGNKVAILAEMVAAFMNNNTIVEEVSPQENIMEREVTERLASWFGYDKDRFSGNIVTGGTTANIAALWVAREKAVAKYGSETQLYVLASKMKHYSIVKTCELLGLNIKFVPLPTIDFKTDTQKALEIADEIENSGKGKIMAVIGIAGETETGLIEDLSGLAEIAKKHGAHFHVDAAYGGPFILSKARDKFTGISQADSITIDPHKLVYVPYEAGAILFRNGMDQQLIENGMKQNARYILTLEEMGKKVAKTETRNYGMARVEGSIGSGGVMATWATLELLGEEGFNKLLDNLIDLTEYAYSLVSSSQHLRPLFVPETNTLLIGLNKEKFSLADRHRLITAMKNEASENEYYISVNEEVDGDDPALRLVIMHPHTTAAHVCELINILDKVAKAD